MINPLISIIIPIYNAAEFLEACLDSILNQSYKNIELILVNDGSKDKSGAICDDYAQKHKSIKVIHLENGGVSRARNIGMQSVSGEYLCFVDSDDVVDNDFIENFVRAIEPEISIYIQGCKIIGLDGSRKECSYPKIGVQGIKTIFEENNLCGQGYAWAKLYKSSLLQTSKVEFNPNVKFSEDLLFILNCLLFSSEVKYLPQCGYNYILREGNASSKSYAYESELECLRIYKAHIGSLSEKFVVDIFSISNVGEIFTMLFSRVRNSIYKDVSLSQKRRLDVLKSFSNEDFAVVRRHQYISNVVVRFGNLFLRRGLLFVYDIYFKLIYKLRK